MIADDHRAGGFLAVHHQDELVYALRRGHAEGGAVPPQLIGAGIHGHAAEHVHDEVARHVPQHEIAAALRRDSEVQHKGLAGTDGLRRGIDAQRCRFRRGGQGQQQKRQQQTEEFFHRVQLQSKDVQSAKARFRQKQSQLLMITQKLDFVHHVM